MIGPPESILNHHPPSRSSVCRVTILFTTLALIDAPLLPKVITVTVGEEDPRIRTDRESDDEPYDVHVVIVYRNTCPCPTCQKWANDINVTDMSPHSPEIIALAQIFA